MINEQRFRNETDFEILFRNKDRDFFIEVFPFPQGNHHTHTQR